MHSFALNILGTCSTPPSRWPSPRSSGWVGTGTRDGLACRASRRGSTGDDAARRAPRRLAPDRRARRGRPVRRARGRGHGPHRGAERQGRRGRAQGRRALPGRAGALSQAAPPGAQRRPLLTKFSTPEELFGPISLKALEQDRYARVVTDKLPEAQFAFVDEVFKANSSILNSLLAAMNERVFHNDGAPLAIASSRCSAPRTSCQTRRNWRRCSIASCSASTSSTCAGRRASAASTGARAPLTRAQEQDTECARAHRAEALERARAPAH
jgi:MoxR domain in the MoxR-vWA-beta-propeller ternary systems